MSDKLLGIILMTKQCEIWEKEILIYFQFFFQKCLESLNKSSFDIRSLISYSQREHILKNIVKKYDKISLIKMHPRLKYKRKMTIFYMVVFFMIFSLWQ